MKLNIGCGNDYREGYINIDKNSSNCDKQIDFIEYFKTLDDNSVDEILALHLFEHLYFFELNEAMKQIYRILKGKLIITVPHYTNPNAFSFPFHISSFSCCTFKYYKTDYDRKATFGFTNSDILFRAVKVRLTFNKHTPQFILNLFGKYEWFHLLYEYTPLHIFPAEYLEVEMIKW